MKNKIILILAVCLCSIVLIYSSCSKDDPIAGGGGSETATCTDGIQNGNETGVDCGGVCDPCSSCTDGIQNGNETGVDCGGSCDPCSSCTDGILNGNETGVDCGGSCSPCKSELILGDWKVVSLSIAGDDYFTLTQNKLLVFSFNSNLTFQSYIVNKDFRHSTFPGTYAPSESFDIVITDSSGPIEYNCSFSSDNNTLTLNGVSSTGSSIIGALERIEEDLCAGVDCNGNSCNFGFCICPSGQLGQNCQGQVGPAGGLIIYDKGSVSNGWRFIEATTQVFPARHAACSSFTGFTLQNIGTGAQNTLDLLIACPSSTNTAARICADYTQNGFDDWVLPSIGTLQQIFPYWDVFGCPEDGIVLLSSSFPMSPGFVRTYSFNCFDPNFTSSGSGSHNDDLETYGFIAVRYY